MSSAFFDREAITDKVIELHRQDGKNVNREQALKHWWFVKSSFSQNQRLTIAGDKAFREANLENWDIPFGKPDTRLSMLTILQTLSKIPCPWYVVPVDKIGEIKIRIYDSRVAIAALLYGTIHEYLEATKT